MKRVAVVGATGAVGQEIVRLLEQRGFPLLELRLFASPRSLGKRITFQNKVLPLETLSLAELDRIDLAFFCAGSAISKEWVQPAMKNGCVVIDSSSAFRTDPDVPLVIPEINGSAIAKHRGLIASPNCAAAILLMPLFSLHRKFQAKRIVASTYQAASGGGAQLLQELLSETKAYIEQKTYAPLLGFPYAFNLYPHNSPLTSSGYVEEELKIAQETRKILEDESIRLTATCVRVPVLRAHSVSANVEFERPFHIEEVYETLQNVPGLQLFEHRERNRFPTPFDASGKNDVFCGRFRVDPTQPNTLEFWSVGDQLLKGAALNAVQIAESVCLL